MSRGGKIDAHYGDFAGKGDVLRFRLWTLEEFAGGQQAWSDLLRRSNVDPLFMSWEWQWAWWAHLAERTDELCLIGGYSADGRLVGLAPLYLHRVLNRGLAACRLEFIGSNWRSITDVFSEYLDFIVDREYELRFARDLAQYLRADERWNDFVLRNVRDDSVAVRLVREYLGEKWYVRSLEPIEAHIVALPSTFSEYAASLKPSARRRILGGRRRLKDVRVRRVPGEELALAFDRLSRYHIVRWGNPQYVGARRDFHLQFAGQMSASGALQLTELSTADGVVSLVYNVRLGETEYNIQSGFQSGVRGVSLGYVHFGYCIERACEAGVRTFDFLAGDGLNRDYKSDFGTARTCMTTVQVVRSGPLAWAYRQYDRHLAAVIARIRRGRAVKPAGSPTTP
jgi:CelD/BcsL family acetyltransferase involved in cellulose biosynthesis